MFNLYLILHDPVCLLEMYLERDVNTKEIVESFEQNASDEPEQTNT